MSSFRDTFTKEDKKENLLNYDDSAFYYFAGAVLLSIVIPWSYYFGKACFLAIKATFPALSKGKGGGGISGLPLLSKAGSKYVYCKCSLCHDNMSKIMKERKCTIMTKCKTISFWVQLVSIIILWMMFVATLIRLSQEAPMQSFDPFEILGVPPTATDREIKKAYRTMSLRLHPDKNPNDPLAASKFLQLTKANAALTDEIEKKNWEKYGNPDGPGTMKIGIGLPRFLLDEDNHLIILSLFFVFLLIVLPLSVLGYYQRQKQFHPSGVRTETVYLYGVFTTEQTRAKQGPEILAVSAEARDRGVSPTDPDALKPLCEELPEYKPKHMITQTPEFQKMYYLVQAHLQRLHHMMTPELREDLNSILKASPRLTQCMIETGIFGHWVLTAIEMIDFRRCLIQAVEPKASPFLQLPHFDSNCVRHCIKAKNAPKSISDFAALSQQDRRGTAELTDEQKLDIEEFLKIFPKIQVEGSIKVDDEGEIVENDVATVTAKLTRLHLKEGEASGPVHAPLFPALKQEEWFFVLSDKATSSLLGFSNSKSPERVIEETMQFQIPAKKGNGKQCCIIQAYCDSYFGIDLITEIPYTILAESEANRTIFTHPEDEALDEEPTLFQQIMGGGDDGDSDDDEEDEDEEAEVTAKQATMKRKSTGDADAPTQQQTTESSQPSSHDKENVDDADDSD